MFFESKVQQEKAFENPPYGQLFSDPMNHLVAINKDSPVFNTNEKKPSCCYIYGGCLLCLSHFLIMTGSRLVCPSTSRAWSSAFAHIQHTLEQLISHSLTPSASASTDTCWGSSNAKYRILASYLLRCCCCFVYSPEEFASIFKPCPVQWSKSFQGALNAERGVLSENIQKTGWKGKIKLEKYTLIIRL